jgi:hypothetical protein
MEAIQIRRLDPIDRSLAVRLVGLQRPAYRIEADLIGFDGIPQLRIDHPTITVSTGTANPPARRLYEGPGFEHGHDESIVPWRLDLPFRQAAIAMSPAAITSRPRSGSPEGKQPHGAA